MKTFMKRIGLGAILAACLFIALIALNYLNASSKVKSSPARDLPKAIDTISILNWNLGYAGLGEESDFIMDGGENLKPPSKQIVEKNLAGIQKILRANVADLVLMQEVSQPDMLTLGVDVLGGVKQALQGYNWYFSTDMRTQFIPEKWALHHGLASFTRVKTAPVKRISLPLEPTRLGGIVQRQYHIQMREFIDNSDNKWAVLNIHLSAFDEGGNIRVKQLKQLIEIASTLYKEGKYVVIGGDWNMQLAPTDFTYTTKKEYLFWLKELPHDLLKPGWSIALDPLIPTVRSNERPYTKGENYITIIDGFLVSPNVETLMVKTINTDFEFTDHQAVFATFKARAIPQRQ